MRYLFIAEKPSEMRAVQSAYKSSTKKIGDIDFFSLSGHICRLAEPKGYEKWNTKWYERELPMIPDPFLIRELDSGKIAELKNKLRSNHYDALIVGTDADIEGNGIYDLIEGYLGLQNYTAYRFFVNDLTPNGIMKAFKEMRDYHTNPRDVRMTEAYRIRSRFDWLIGFNLSVAYTTKTGFLMKVGRVKAPTLKLVYDNCKAIDSFQSSTAFQPMIVVDEFAAGLVDDEEKTIAYPDRRVSENLLEQLSDTAEVILYETRKTSRKADQLYKLSDIQYEAGRVYGYTPSETLNAIQTLYENYKVVSYPRTDGRYVSSEKAKKFRELLEPVKKIPELRDIALKITKEDIRRVQNDSSYVNDAEVHKSSHDALIPTGVDVSLKTMKQIERDICIMIFRRFLAIFLPPMIEEKSKCVLESSGKKFLCSGSKVLDLGYMELYQSPKNNPLPQLTKGAKLSITQRFSREIVSRPPARYTQATLLRAMENIQKYVENGELRNALKKAKGIGQPSSRAAIISELLQTGYIEERQVKKTKYLFITQTGKNYIESLGNCSVVNPELSAEWEMHLTDIREGRSTYDDVYPKIIEYLKKILDELDQMDFLKFSNFDGKCPVCGNPIKKLQNGYRCSAYPECQFSIWGTIAEKKLTERNIRDLLEGRITELIHGFKKKDGTLFNARLVVRNGRVEWASALEIGIDCPKCGKPLVQRENFIGCSGYPDCKFSVPLKISGKSLTKKQIKDLILKRRTGLIKGFISKNGREFDACLTMDNELNIRFEFPSRR